MEPQKTEMPRLRAARGEGPAAAAPLAAPLAAPWMTPGAGPMEPTPHVPSPVA